MLEDWATWEKNLEDAAERDEVARSIKEAADRSTDNIAIHPIDGDTSTDEKVTTGTAVSPEEGSAAFAGDAGGSQDKVSDEEGRVRSSTSHRRTPGEKDHPASLARWQALRLWTGEPLMMNRRFSSNVSKCRNTWGSDTAKMSKTVPGTRRNSSISLVPDVTSGLEPSSAVSTWCDHRVASRRESSMHIRQQQQQSSLSWNLSRRPGMDFVRYTPRPWRSNMKRPSSKLSVTHAVDSEAALAEIETAPSTPRSPQHTPDLPQTHRPSPWAQSPSRETAGGLLVNQNFFYGSGGKSMPGKVPGDTPDFEAGWMRQLREKFEDDSDLLAQTDAVRQSQRKSFMKPTKSFRHSTEGKAKISERGSNVKPARGRPGNAVKGASQPVDIWGEVDSGIRRRKSGEIDCALSGVDDKAASGRSEAIDVRSFQDRLRYTPLSQGAWVVDRGDEAKGPCDDRKHTIASGDTSPCLSAEEHPAVESDGQRVSHQSVTGRIQSSRPDSVAEMKEEAKVLSSRKVSRNQEATGLQQPMGGEKIPPSLQQPSGVDGIQGLYDNILLKLRGEIDSATREGIVLRAAEDARGALARARAHNVSARTRRAYISGASRDTRSASEGTVSAPEVIDYDHVEATLSLIELASRAAGPDAGRQMLRALESLAKIHPRAKLADQLDVGGSTVERLAVDARGIEGSQRGPHRGSASSCESSACLHDTTSGMLSKISGWFWKGGSSNGTRRQQAASYTGEDDTDCAGKELSDDAARRLLEDNGILMDETVESHFIELDSDRCPQDAKEAVYSTGDEYSNGGQTSNEIQGSKPADGTVKASADEITPCNGSRPHNSVAEESSSSISVGGETMDTTDEFHMAWDGSSDDAPGRKPPQCTTVDPAIATVCSSNEPSDCRTERGVSQAMDHGDLREKTIGETGRGHDRQTIVGMSTDAIERGNTLQNADIREGQSTTSDGKQELGVFGEEAPRIKTPGVRNDGRIHDPIEAIERGTCSQEEHGRSQRGNSSAQSKSDAEKSLPP